MSTTLPLTSDTMVDAEMSCPACSATIRSRLDYDAADRLAQTMRERRASFLAGALCASVAVPMVMWVLWMVLR